MESAEVYQHCEVRGSQISPSDIRYSSYLGGKTVVREEDTGGWLVQRCDGLQGKAKTTCRLKQERARGGDAPYFATANKKDCLLIPANMRDFEILRASGRKGAGGIGQSNIWYAEDKYGAQIKPKVLEYITKWERQRQLAVRLE